jgi:glycerophosphoryl diester phosphodiesterase
LPPTEIKKVTRPHLFAHRGGNAAINAKENTERAFNSAIRLGYRFIETDIIVTKDGKVICYHGAHNWYAKRLSGLELRRKLQKLTYDQINTKGIAKGSEMPLLENILKKFPDICFSIDVKTRQAITPLAKVIKEAEAQNRVVITSFSLYRSLRTNRLVRGTYRGSCTCLSRVSLKAFPPFSLIFFIFAGFIGITYLQVSYRRITKNFIKQARKRGITVYAWTVNEEAIIKKMLALGVDGVMSDESKLLLETAKSTKA